MYSETVYHLCCECDCCGLKNQLDLSKNNILDLENLANELVKKLLKDKDMY